MIDTIELSIPARADLLQLVRLAAGVVAARADLGLHEVEDLRLAVEELCLSLVGPSGDAPGRLRLRYDWDDDTIEITCTLEGGEPGPAAASVPEDEHVRQDLSSHILDALVDEHGRRHAPQGPSAWLRVLRRRPAEG